MLLRFFGIAQGNVPGTSPPDFQLGIQANGVSVTKTQLGTLLGTVVTNNLVTGLTALAGGGQTGATALVSGRNNFTVVATAADSAKLPTATAGLVVIVRNTGAASLAVFPFLGDSINAMSANLSVDIPPLCSVTFFAINGTVWYAEIGAALYQSAPSTQKGGVRRLVADMVGNTLLTITNAAMGQATVLTIPDPGATTANYLLDTGAQTVGGVQTFSAINITSLATGISAGTTQTQVGATVLSKEFNNLTTVGSANDGVALPAAVAGKQIWIRNAVATGAKVWPAVGASDTIDGGSADAGVAHAASKTVLYVALDSTAWVSIAIN